MVCPQVSYYIAEESDDIETQKNQRIRLSPEGRLSRFWCSKLLEHQKHWCRRNGSENGGTHGTKKKLP
jgi:hypothetical protein